MSAPRYRPLALGGSLEADFVRRADGATVVVSREPLGAYPERLTDRLVQWATRDPDRTLVAKRVDGGDWRRVSYGEALRSCVMPVSAATVSRPSSRRFLSRSVCSLPTNQVPALDSAL